MVDRDDTDFLDYYAGVLEREAAARSGQNVQWMVDGAERARRQAAELRIPAQADLFGAAA